MPRVAVSRKRGKAAPKPAQLGMFAAASTDRWQYRPTEYRTVAPLFERLSLPGGHWVEPCAGDGHIVRHVAQARRELGQPLPSFWTCVEIGDSPALRALPSEQATLTAGGRIWVHDRQDFLTYEDDDRSRLGVSVVFTNWPWYGIAPLVLRAFVLYPNAHVVGLCCAREPLDNGRHKFFQDHAPDKYECAGRQKMGHKNGYAHPVQWLHWPLGGRNRRKGTWEIL